ncbi:MAG: ribose-phosphate pyrophosphokinase [Sphingomonadales bacterium]
MKAILFGLPGNQERARSLAGLSGSEVGEIEIRPFPDGESYVRFETDIKNSQVIFVCALDRPDDKIIPLAFAAAGARDLGAKNIGLICPYLPYMRQDIRFLPGEGVTSEYFPKIIEPWFDWLITVDPHLHRRSSLAEVYSIPTKVVHAAPQISHWIRKNIKDPVLIGPDAESEQWVSVVARDAGAPFLVLQKTRTGDREVAVSVPDLARWKGKTPVLVDDIISTARTMIETVGHIVKAGLKPPVCIGVHAIFAANAYRELQTAGAGQIITCNTIPHETNGIDLDEILLAALKDFIG